METMADLGVTGLLELPPGGHPDRDRQARAQGRRDLRPEDPRPARRRPEPSSSDTAASSRLRMSEPLTSLPDPPADRRPLRDPRRRLLPAQPGRAQRRAGRGDRLQRRVDPAALRHHRAPLGHRRRDRPDDVGRLVPHGPRRGPAIYAAQVDAVVVATVSHFMQTPAIAPAIAHELGTERAAAFDVSAACAGFCHGVALASDMVRAGTARYVLVIGVERLSDQLDLTDRGTAFIFADGAGAVLVGPRDERRIGPVVWGSDGAQFDLIRSREDCRDALHGEHRDVVPPLTMQGSAVFRWAVLRDGQGRPRDARAHRAQRRRPRPVRPAPGQHADHRRDGARPQAAAHGADRPRHRPPGQHLRRLRPARAGRDDRRAARRSPATPRC